MKNLTIVTLLQQFPGLSFVACGPFLIADLSVNEELFTSVPTGEYGMEEVPAGQKTEPHEHDFLSLYKSSELDVVCKGQRFELPKFALALVLPHTEHSWIPKGAGGGAVGSTDHEHARQVLEFA